jgi:hypothetical protein
MFKVGQRVWVITEKKFDTIEVLSIYTCILKSGRVMFNIDLHETADDMFERLGYKEEIQIVKNKETGIKYKDKTYEIEFDFGFEGYFIDIIANDFDYDMFIKPQLHLAIHQKLVELGWV